MRPPRTLALCVVLAPAPLAAAQTLLHELVSPNAVYEGWFGATVAGVDDVDGDGVPDVLVGAYGEHGGGQEHGGRAYVLSGATGAVLHTLVSPDPEEYGVFGSAVAGIDDVDGDGRADLVVGADGESPDLGLEDAGARYAGLVYVFSGASGGLLRTLESPNAERYGVFGFSVSRVPDVDGDGKADLLVGAPGETDGAVGAGRAYLFSGVTGALLRTLESPNPELEGAFAISAAGVEDADGDGRGDLLVGAWYENGGLPDAGRAYVFSGASGALLYELRSPNKQFRGHFGWSASGVADVDGDGRGDLLVGAPYESTDAIPDHEDGRAYLFSGATGALLLTLTPPNPAPGDTFGYAVSGVPDVDGDGRTDLVVSAIGDDLDWGWEESWGSGRAYVLSGATGALLYEIVPPNPLDSPDSDYGVGNLFGSAVAGIEDTDGDGRGEVLVGARGEDLRAWYNEDVGRAYHFSTPVLTLSAAARDSVLVRGDTLRFDVALTNLTAEPRTLGLRLEVLDLWGFNYPAALGTVAVGGLDTLAATYGVRVGGAFPRGYLTATVTAFDSVGTDLARDHFVFEVTVGTATEGGPEEEALGAVVPNPFADQATVSFGLPRPSRVRLAVYDVLGRELAVLVEGERAAGQHEAVLDGSRLPSGTYLVRLEAGGAVATRRVTLVR
jgi:hypothetical protein